MKDKFMWLVIAVASLMILCDVKVSARALAVPYNNEALSYIGNNDNDDVGLLLTVLLLATRGRGCGDCCCCNGNSGNTVPIPYPIPIPTNNPIIKFGNSDKSDVPDEDDKKTKQVVNVITKNDSDTETETDTQNNVTSNSKSNSGASAKNTSISTR